MVPWVGLLAGIVAVVLGIRAFTAGFVNETIIAYLAGSLELLAGYVTIRRSLNHTIDIVLVGGIAAIVVVSIFILTQFHLPPPFFS